MTQLDFSAQDAIEPPALTTILGCALEEFFERGYHGTSVRNIARRVGVTIPAIYYHHENKEAVLVALLNAAMDTAIGGCERALDVVPDTPLDRFNALVTCLTRYMVTYPKLASMDSEIRGLSPENRRAYLQRCQVLEDMLKSSIADGIDTQVFDATDPGGCARAIIGMLQAIALWHHRDHRTPDSVIDTYRAISLRIVGYS